MSNVNMGEVTEINLLEMMGGAVGERVSYELAKIMRNCKDLNTEAKKARTLTVEFSVVPTDARDSAAVRVSVKSKLVPVKALDTTLLIGGTQQSMRLQISTVFMTSGCKNTTFYEEEVQ